MSNLKNTVSDFINTKKFKAKISYVGGGSKARVGSNALRASSSTKRPLSRLELAAQNSPRARAQLFKFRKSKTFRRNLRKGLLVLLAVFLLTGVIGGVWFISYLQRLDSQLPSVDDPFGDKATASIIYDRNGKELYRLFDEYNRDPVNIKDIPPLVQWSFLAAEDVDYYSHQGFDAVGILRCGINNVLNRGVSCGGSTVTQQMVKITSIGDAPKLERKLKELLMALKVEQAYTKEEILQMYFTVTPFGSNIYGITSGAKFYFNKKPKDLTLAEAAILAAVVQSPYYNSPTLNKTNGKERAEARQKYVLSQMKEKKDKINAQHRLNIGDSNAPELVTDELITQALAQEMKYQAPIFANKRAPHFIDYVLDELERGNYKNAEEPFTTSELQTLGLRIYTTLDYDLQRVAEDSLKNTVNGYSGTYGMKNGAVMVTKPSTGEIISYVGSRDFYGKKEGCKSSNETECDFDPQVDILRSKQSPGSSTKPHGYYEAFNQGLLYPGSFLPDIPIQIPGFNIQNWNDQFIGITGATNAGNMLATSRNLPAVEVIEMITVEAFVKVMRAFGYTTFQDASQFGVSAILGGSDVIPAEHAQAYSVFANGGVLTKNQSVLKIIDKDGQEIYKFKKPDSKSVANAQAIYLVNQSLKNNYGISWDGRDIADKTGTSENHKDLWAAVYSPDMVIVAWMGNNNNDPLRRNTFAANIVIPWMRTFARQMGSDSLFNARTPFQRPGGITRGGGCSGECVGEVTGLVNHFMIEGKIPKPDSIRAKVLVCSDQQDKLARQIDIELGKAVEKTAIRWLLPNDKLQAALDKYIKDSTGWENIIPTEPCTINRIPTGTDGPWFGTRSVVGGANIHVQGKVYTTAGTITGLQVFLDNVKLNPDPVLNGPTFDATYNVPAAFEPGYYKVRMVVTDSNGKTAEKINNLTVISLNTPNIGLTSPSGNNLDWGTEIGNTSVNLNMTYSGVGTVADPTLFVSKNGGGYTVVGLAGPGNVWSWGNGISQPAAGNTDTYRFYVKGKTKTTGVLTSLVPIAGFEIRVTN